MKIVKQLHIMFLLSSLIFSCKDKSNISIEDVIIPEDAVSITDLRSDSIKVGNLITELAGLSQIEGAYIGFGAQKSTQKDYVEQLTRICDTTYLSSLTSHKSPTVRLISFRALKRKGFQNLRKILERHLSDTETYQLFAGCLVTPEPVNLNMYQEIEETLSESDRIHFKEKIIKHLKKSGNWSMSLY